MYTNKTKHLMGLKADGQPDPAVPQAIAQLKAWRKELKAILNADSAKLTEWLRKMEEPRLTAVRAADTDGTTKTFLTAYSAKLYTILMQMEELAKNDVHHW